MTSLLALVDQLLIKVYRRMVVPKWTRIGKNVFIGRRVRLDKILNGALITIDDGAYITSGVTILCHDVSSLKRVGFYYAAPVFIGRNSFIGVNSIIMPGVRIGHESVVGAGSVVTKDVPDRTVVAGVPAKIIQSVEEVDSKRLLDLEKKTVVPFSRCRRFFKNKETEELIEKAYADWGFIIKGW